MKWLPIATAPKNLRILLYSSTFGVVSGFYRQWQYDDWEQADDDTKKRVQVTRKEFSADYYLVSIWMPTHWAEMPSVPDGQYTPSPRRRAHATSEND